MPSPTATIVATIDFSEAIKALTDGQKVYKLEWLDKEYYGILRDGILQLHKPDGKYYAWTISEGDLLGTDWIIL